MCQEGRDLGMEWAPQLFNIFTEYSTRVDIGVPFGSLVIMVSIYS